MKIKYLILALLPLSFTACQTVQQVSDHVVSQMNTTATKTLTEYHWTYQNSQASKPLVLNFNNNQQLSIQTGCNGQGGTWKVEGNQLVTSTLVSTMMACEDDLMKQEQFSSNLLSKQKVPFEISTANGQATLTLTDAKGQKHVFAGTKVADSSLLSQYTWSYQPDSSKKPITLSFSKDNRLSVDSGCNRQGTSWKVENDLIITSDIASTLMACEPALMKQEQFATELLQKRQIPFDVDASNPEQRRLIIEDTKGQKYTFVGTMTPETKYQSEGQIVFLEISPETKSCTGVAPQTCMQVREVKYDDKGLKTYVDKNWTLYYGQIEGFEHNPKQRSIVRVKRFAVKNPAADQSSQADVLDMVVEQEIVKK